MLEMICSIRLGKVIQWIRLWAGKWLAAGFEPRKPAKLREETIQEGIRVMTGASMSRRTLLKSIGTGVLATSALSSRSKAYTMSLAADRDSWDATWDAAVLENTLLRMDKTFDTDANLIAGHVGPEYSYQSNLRSQVVHPTRTSMEYALYLLESKDKRGLEIAIKVLAKMEELQEKNPGSKWFGLWSWYAEEPLASMPAVDFNWADFNGSLLLCMLFRHRARLAPAVVEQMQRMLRRCCSSIKKRNVSMGYTNIACMGNFVSLAGAEVLQDDELHVYAQDRLRRFAATIDQTGSFNEYNSPTYNKVVVQNITRTLMFVKDSTSLELSRSIHERIWLHVGTHWHLPTQQIAAPMSRCYFNDLGTQIWIQKALNNALLFIGKLQLRIEPLHENEDVALLDYRCPDDIKAYFTATGQARVHREIFLLGSPAENTAKPASMDVEGTTYLHPHFCLGSANRSDFWVQRRPLMAYWGMPKHPVQCLQVKVLKDDYDFSSGLFYSVQSNGAVLGQICFRSDGGDKHISLDPIREHKSVLSRLVVQVRLDVWMDDWKLFVSDEEVAGTDRSLPVDSRLCVDAGTIKFGFRFLDVRFAAYQPKLKFVRSAEGAMFELTLMSSDRPVTVDWNYVQSAGCGLALLVAESGTPDASTLPTSLEVNRFDLRRQEDLSVMKWRSPDGELEVTAASTVRAGDDMDRAFRSTINGRMPPMQRLSDVRLAG